MAWQDHSPGAPERSHEWTADASHCSAFNTRSSVETVLAKYQAATGTKYNAISSEYETSSATEVFLHTAEQSMR